MNTLIFHIDMDAFYASVEQRDDPTLIGKPVIIGAKPGMRGVVSTCSYEARKFGIHSAMPISIAYKKCPHGIFLQPDMPKYQKVSQEVIKCFYNFSPLVEQISIDEAFLDMSGTRKLLGEPITIAKNISDYLIRNIGITASIGIAPNKFLAKLASDIKKPKGITITPFDKKEIIKWLSPMPVNKIWGVGKETVKKLNSINVVTINDLQNIPREQLEKFFGVNGKQLSDLRFGIDKRNIIPQRKNKSISNETTFQKDICDLQILTKKLLFLSGKISQRLRNNNFKSKQITLIWRTSNHKRFTASKTYVEPINDTLTIYNTVKKLLEKKWNTINAVRLIGVGVSIFNKSSEQLNLFEEKKNLNIEKWNVTDKLIDAVIKKNGSKIFRAGEK